MSTTMTLPKKTDDNALLAELALLRADNERLKAENAKRANGPLSLKVSEKGAVSLIGMGRFPVTLYKTQWLKVADAMPTILAFIQANDAKLSQGKTAPTA
jgi:hypothetical protein